MSWLHRVIARSAPDAASRPTFAPSPPPSADPDDPELLGEQLPDEAPVLAPAPGLAPARPPAAAPARPAAPPQRSRSTSAAAPMDQDPPRSRSIAQPAAPVPTAPALEAVVPPPGSARQTSAFEAEPHDAPPSRATPAPAPRMEADWPRPEPARAASPTRSVPTIVEAPGAERRLLERTPERVVALSPHAAPDLRTQPSSPQVGELVPARRAAVAPSAPEAPPSRLSIGRVVVQVQPAPVVVAPPAPRPAPRPRPATPSRPSKLRFGLGQS